ncbi:MAG: hypothetical protein WC477_06790 [Patescibacteria group bacterium]
MKKSLFDTISELIRKANPNLSEWDVGQLVGEAVLGRSLRFSSCPRMLAAMFVPALHRAKKNQAAKELDDEKPVFSQGDVVIIKSENKQATVLGSSVDYDRKVRQYDLRISGEERVVQRFEFELSAKAEIEKAFNY